MNFWVSIRRMTVFLDYDKSDPSAQLEPCYIRRLSYTDSSSLPIPGVYLNAASFQPGIITTKGQAKMVSRRNILKGSLAAGGASFLSFNQLFGFSRVFGQDMACLLYTSDAADE